MEALITQLLASVAGGRRYWNMAPQGIKVSGTTSDNYGGPGPYIVLYRVDGVPGYTYQGRDGLVTSRVQANCYGATYSAAKATANDLIAALDTYRGGSIQLITVDSEGRDLTDTNPSTSERVFAVSVDLIIHHTSS
ncbi:hypothetical protein [Nitratireductor basaltis]|uniref:Uncharacterized protein n=1 Tax=Nitratireductor basaltis TaxID=472175 RepID=A0A084UBJ8_9HYPH|nr:hypothetical protein [Nitratireductor basaltis]KFB10334.1 hypothetical protein EL18_01365 [Nitratireductor basaltis]